MIYVEASRVLGQSRDFSCCSLGGLPACLHPTCVNAGESHRPLLSSAFAVPSFTAPAMGRLGSLLIYARWKEGVD